MLRNVLLCSLISLFFSCRLPSPLPHFTKPYTDDTREPSWADRHIIPHYQTAGKARNLPPPPPPPNLSQDPLDTEEQIILQECGLGQVEGSIRVKKAPWRHLRPLCCTVSSETGGCQNSDNNFGSRTMFGLALVIVFIERTSLLIKLCLLSGAVLLGVFFLACLLCQTVARKLSPTWCL